MNRENPFTTKQNLAQFILKDDYFVSQILFLVIGSLGMVSWASSVRRNIKYAARNTANLCKQGKQ